MVLEGLGGLGGMGGLGGLGGFQEKANCTLNPLNLTNYLTLTFLVCMVTTKYTTLKLHVGHFDFFVSPILAHT